MKPELKAMIDTLETSMDFFTPGPRRAPQILKAAFLSSLHWRGDELWAGPFYFGHVATIRRGTGAQSVWAPAYRALRHAASKPEARAALEAAAKKQINEWFKEQAK